MNICRDDRDPHAPDPTPALRLETLATRDDADWDRLVAVAPQGNVFLRSDWLAMLCDTDAHGLRIHRLGCRNRAGRLVAGWVVPYRRQWGRLFANGFDFFYNGPLLEPGLSSPNIHHVSERQRALSLLARGLRESASLVVAEAHPEFHDARALLYDGWIVSAEYTHLWDQEVRETTLERMNREKRREIRRGLESHVFRREPRADLALTPFLKLYRATMQKFGWLPTAAWEDQFRTRLRWMADRDGCRLYTASTAEGQLLAGVLVLLSREDRTAYFWRMGAATDRRDSRVVPALYWWTAMELGVEDPDIRHINFGGSPPPSLSQFKDYLAATPTLHFRLIHKPPSAHLGLWTLSERTKLAIRRARAHFGGLTI
jgi:hypothetical protein